MSLFVPRCMCQMYFYNMFIVHVYELTFMSVGGAIKQGQKSSQTRDQCFTSTTFKHRPMGISNETGQFPGMFLAN